MPRFRGGVHPPERKWTASKPTERARTPQRVIIPLRQHVGAPCDPLVKVGDTVKRGQKIGDSAARVSAPVHSSISGVVSKISTELAPSGEFVTCITVESDGRDEEIQLPPLDPNSPKEVLLQRIRECGVVGMGGAGFPTHIKLNPPKPVHTLIVNGVECEPYITCDHRLMLEKPEEIMEGAKIAANLLGVRRVIVAVEDNKLDAAERMRQVAGGFAEVSVLKTRYPRGDERHLIKSLLGVEVPAGGLPFDVGVVVQNVSTLKAVADAVKGKALVERVVTVTGEVGEPKNLLVRVGTPFSDLLEQCGGVAGKAAKIIAGGPMTGVALSRDAPVAKTTGCVLVMGEVRREVEEPCIRCGRCLDACPMGLMPTLLAKLVRAGRYEECLSNYILSCDECGCCGYVCPSKIPLVHLMREGKLKASALVKK
ncbi:MAG: electron transport complex subunit RsxC [Candidatus Hadarchaeales archaeon]